MVESLQACSNSAALSRDGRVGNVQQVPMLTAAMMMCRRPVSSLYDLPWLGGENVLALGR